jgi:hypothetical protein
MEFAWSSAGGFGFYQGGVAVSIFKAIESHSRKRRILSLLFIFFSFFFLFVL